MINFEDIPVSTQTYIAYTDIAKINLQQCIDAIEPNDVVINVKYGTILKGVDLHPRKLKRKYSEMESCVPPKTSFLNCVTMTVAATSKRINIKMFNNGVFQMTGCKNYDHVIESLNITFSLLTKLNLLPVDCVSPIEIYTVSVMRNIDFDLGYNIDREKLALFIHNTTEYRVLPMTKRYMAIKIKIEIPTVYELPVVKLAHCYGYGVHKVDTITYKNFMETRNITKLNKPRYISISVFQNGKVLMSSVDEYYQKKYFEEFTEYVMANKKSVCLPDAPRFKTFKLG